MSKRECADAESAAKHLKELLSGTDILKEICTIRKGQRIATVNKQIEAYGFKAVDDNNRLQTGQLWLLTGRNGDAIKALNAGQSLDIRSEIEYDVGVMYGSISGKKVNCPYRKLRESYEELTFYEVDTDGYLERVFGSISDCDGIVRIMYEMSREYMAEALIAYKTGAEYWDFNRSGMDKRSYYRILDMPDILKK